MSETFNESLNMNSLDLQILLSIGSTGSLRATAAALFTSQPAISRAVNRLEKQLGSTLVERGPRGARLTTAGELAAKYSRSILQEMQATKLAVTRNSHAQIRLGSAPTAAAAFVAPFLAKWRISNENVGFTVVEDGSDDLHDRLLANECDIAIVAPPVPADFDWEPLKRLTICAYFPFGHRLGKSSQPVPVQELAEHDLVVNSQGFLSGRLFTALCDSHGLAPHIVYRSNHGQTLAAMAEADVAVAIFADSVDLRGFSLQRRPVMASSGRPLTFELAVTWHKKHRTDHVADFGSKLSQFVKKHL